MDIQNRVVNYYKNNQFIQKYLKGLNPSTNEILLSVNGVDKSLTIDELEAIKSEEELNNMFNPNASAPVAPAAPTIETPEQFDNSVETLNDIKILTELKNKTGLDNLLKKFAVNPTTGLIDINTAISIVTRNTMNEVENAIKNKMLFNPDSNLYDIEGKYIGEIVTGYASEDEQIVSSFNNIKIYIEASKMYPDQANYNEDQINTFMQTYIQKVKEELHGNGGSVPVAEPKQEAIKPDTQVPPVQQEMVQPQNTASAGFADIFVLTVIVLVYAVIIVNLILKIK